VLGRYSKQGEGGIFNMRIGNASLAAFVFAEINLVLRTIGALIPRKRMISAQRACGARLEMQ
jgi:hypothetical protein